jgi:cytochrome c oxidase assembly factor CtaG
MGAIMAGRGSADGGENELMTRSLPAPELSGLLTQWSWQPVALLAVAALGFWYARAVRKLTAAGRHWPAGRSVLFGLGLALFLWTTSGFLQTYLPALFWVWTTQTLILLLIVPLLLLFGQPLQLARLRSGHAGLVHRLLRSRAGRFLANPLVGPALVPLLSAVLFFGPLPAWVVQAPPLGWLLHLLLVAVGALVVLPLVDADADPSSLAVGLALAIGSFELVLDAIPGIALRLHATLVTSYFAHRTQYSWSPGDLHDQQIAGAVLWCVAELIDLPFLLLVFRRWLRADARDAAAADAILDAERTARGALPDSDVPGGVAAGDEAADAPWWLSDPTMQQRLRRRP